MDGHSRNIDNLNLLFKAYYSLNQLIIDLSELFLSIDNESGIVLLEEPGKSPIREVETDIETFLDRLEPKMRQPDIY